MQLPLTKADFKKNSVTRIARSLMKFYPEGHKIMLSNATNLIAKILGYKDLYEAKSRALDISSMIAVSYDAAYFHSRASDIVFELTGVKFDGTRLPLRMLDALRITQSTLDSKTWYRIEKKFCDLFLGVKLENKFERGKLFDFISQNIDIYSATEKDLAMSVGDAVLNSSKLDRTLTSDNFVGMAYGILNDIIDNDKASALGESERMYLFKSLFERHFIVNIAQSLGGIYLDNPHNWCELYWFASSDHNGHCWKKSWVENGCEITFRLYEFEKKCSSLKAFNWVCSVADLSDDQDRMLVIRSVIKGSILVKNSLGIAMDELELLSLLGDESDQTMAMIVGLIGKIKLDRLSEISRSKLSFDTGAYISDYSYMDAVFSRSVAVVIDEVAVKSDDYNVAASQTIQYALNPVIEKFGASLSVYVGSAHVDSNKFRQPDAPDGLDEFQTERYKLLLQTLSDLKVNSGVDFFEVSPIEL